MEDNTAGEYNSGIIAELQHKDAKVIAGVQSAEEGSLMTLGEGMLVGSQSFALFLVHSESEESPYVAARPFRVNAGPVYAYVRVSEKTRYLSELTSGDDVLIVNAETIKLMGKTKPISVVDLKEGDEVLVHVTETARHFGIAVEEMVIEK